MTALIGPNGCRCLSRDLNTQVDTDKADTEVSDPESIFTSTLLIVVEGPAYS